MNPQNDDHQIDRQNEAYLMRFRAESCVKAAFFWEACAAGALLLHIYWLMVIFLILATLQMITSWDLERRADRLWPDPRDWIDDDPN